MLANCPKPVVKSSGGNTADLWQHLVRAHCITKEAAFRQSAGQCDCPTCASGQPIAGPHAIPGDWKQALASARVDVQAGKAAALDQAAQTRAHVLPCGQTKLLVPMAAAESQKVLKAFTRDVVISHLRPQNMIADSGFQSFCNTLVAASGGSRFGHGGTRCVARIIASDFEAMKEKLVPLLRDQPPETATLHWDTWTDAIRRPWLIIYDFALDKKTFTTIIPTIGLVNLAPWSGSDIGGPHAAAPAATAIRSQWRVRLGLGEVLPVWGTSDSAAPAVATGSLLGLNQKRCLVHIAVIPRGRLLFPSDTRAGPRSPKHVDAMESLRSWGKHYYKNAEHISQFQRDQKRAQAEGKLPHLDSSSKWQSSYKMTRIATASWGLWTEICAMAPADAHHPRLIPVAHKELVTDVHKVLEILDATVALLQKDETLMAEYFPIMYSMRQAISALNSEFGALYLDELDGAESRTACTQIHTRDSRRFGRRFGDLIALPYIGSKPHF